MKVRGKAERGRWVDDNQQGRWLTVIRFIVRVGHLKNCTSWTFYANLANFTGSLQVNSNQLKLAKSRAPSLFFRRDRKKQKNSSLCSFVIVTGRMEWTNWPWAYGELFLVDWILFLFSENQWFFFSRRELEQKKISNQAFGSIIKIVGIFWLIVNFISISITVCSMLAGVQADLYVN